PAPWRKRRAESPARLRRRARRPAAPPKPPAAPRAGRSRAVLRPEPGRFVSWASAWPRVAPELETHRVGDRPEDAPDGLRESSQGHGVVQGQQRRERRRQQSIVAVVLDGIAEVHPARAEVPDPAADPDRI